MSRRLAPWIAVLALLAFVACDVDVSLEERRCDSQHSCLEDYLCLDGICVAAGLTGALGGRCYPNFSCDDELHCEDGVCVEPTDAPPTDAGSLDAGALDAGPHDAGEIDAGADDAGRNDAGANDAGFLDAGANDAGANDAGANDAGPDDAGPDDAGPDDAGPDDAGPDDAGPDDAGPPDGGPSLPASCRAQLQANPGSPSGLYDIETSDGVARVFCEMVRNEGGWTRVADVSASSGECPGDWQWNESPVACARALTTGGSRSASFAPVVDEYSEVMGYVRGIQKGNTDTFGLFGGGQSELDLNYVDGVSLTVSGSGGARQHLWTYVAAWSDNDNSESSTCPCLGGVGAPAFVGEHFWCEAGTSGVPSQSTWYTADPLWDGDGTGSDCDTDGDPSWFVRTLGAPSNLAIEVRVMADQASENEDIGVTDMQLYVR